MGLLIVFRGRSVVLPQGYTISCELSLITNKLDAVPEHTSFWRKLEAKHFWLKILLRM